VQERVEEETEKLRDLPIFLEFLRRRGMLP